MKGQKHFILSEKIRFRNYKYWDTYSFNKKKFWVQKELNHLRKAAYAGHPEAQFNLSSFYQYGVYIDGYFYLNDEDKALYWMKKSADSLYPDAVESMALLYESHPKLQDLRKAEIYYELYDKLMGKGMSKNRKLFLTQLKNGLFIKDENSYYRLVKDWKKRLR